MKKLALATIIGAAFAAPAQAVTVMAEDGWTLGVSGSINQFLTHTNDDAAGESFTEVRDGLLPAFLSFDMKAPTMNGLDIAAHISISPSTNTLAQDQAGGANTNMEQREVYFTVDGSFGQVLAGKALGLYGSSAILNEQTLFGVGWGTGGNGATTLGGIGIGYDYADWRSQVRWTSPDMNGFKLALAIVDTQGTGSNDITGSNGPVGPLAVLSTTNYDSNNLRYEAQLTYAGAFDGGSYNLWAEMAQQDHDAADLAGIASADPTSADVEDAQYWAIGGKAAFGGFEVAAQYSEAEDTLAVLNDVQDVASFQRGEWNNYFVQAGYRFAGTTLVSASYSELEDDLATSDEKTDRTTVGVYHDVNSNLKLVAEYTKVENDAGDLDQDIYSVGGFVFF